MQLEITQAGQTLTTISLLPGIHFIGRGQDNDICLNDSGVSRQHARLEVSDDFLVTVVDLHSTNGTWLGNSKVTSSCWEQKDTVLTIGDCQLFLRNTSQVPTQHPVALPYTPQNSSTPLALSTAPPKPSYKVVADKRSPRNEKKAGDTSLFIGVILLIAPFVIFLGENVFSTNTAIQAVEFSQKEKMQRVLENDKSTAIRIKLTKVKELLADENFQPAQDILHDVLQKDPANIQAATLKKQIVESIAEREQIAKEQEREQLRMQREQEKQQKKKMLAQLKIQAEAQALKKDFLACLQTAKKMLTLDPGNRVAVAAIEFCSQSIVASGAGSNEDVIEREKKKLLAQLQEVHKQGDDAVNKKRYEAALKIWSKAAVLDPDNIFDITKEINIKAASLRKNISKRVKKNINRGHAAIKKEDYVKALRYFKKAHTIKPSDEKVKQWYEKQLIENHNLAEELYHEAIAYASLDSMQSAHDSINQAKFLAKGNDKLIDRIDKKIADFNKR